MIYYYDLYVSESLQRKKKQIIKKLENNQFQLNRYVIVLSEKEDEYLEIYNSAVLTQEAYHTKDMFAVGITDCYEEALDFITRITQQVYEETKGADIRAYIRSRQYQFEEGNV